VDKHTPLTPLYGAPNSVGKVSAHLHGFNHGIFSLLLWIRGTSSVADLSLQPSARLEAEPRVYKRVDFGVESQNSGLLVTEEIGAQQCPRGAHAIT